MIHPKLRSKVVNLIRYGVAAELKANARTQGWAPGDEVAQTELFSYYQGQAAKRLPLPSVFDTGYRVFSQFDEDGILVFVFAVLGMKSKRFVDIGGGDGISGSNTANLAINFGWHGLLIDGSEESIAIGTAYYGEHPDTWAYPPKFKTAMVKRENINALIRDEGFQGEIDLLSIDIDGNDYWVWDAIDCVQPRVVIIETHIEFGFNNVVVPYDADYVYPGRHPDYHGASPVAMARLAEKKGYRLVGANRFGFNTIWVRKQEAADLLPTVTVEQVLRHPRNPERFKLFEPIKDYPYVHP